MAKWWRVVGWVDWPEPVEVEKETDKFVYVGGRRQAKNGWNTYFPTLGEALDYKESRLYKNVERAQSSLECMQKKYQEFLDKRAKE